MSQKPCSAATVFMLWPSERLHHWQCSHPHHFGFSTYRQSVTCGIPLIRDLRISQRLRSKSRSAFWVLSDAVKWCCRVPAFRRATCTSRCPTRTYICCFQFTFVAVHWFLHWLGHVKPGLAACFGIDFADKYSFWHSASYWQPCFLTKMAFVT